MTGIRVLVADDQALLRGSFRVLLETAPGLSVVGEAADGAEAVRLAVELRPDVVLMDVRMPVLDGIEATRRLRAEAPEVRVLVLTMFDDDSAVFTALRAGAAGFLLKDTPPADLLRAITVIAAGESLLAPTVTRRLIEEFTRGPDPTPTLTPGPVRPLTGVTDREQQVLTLIARGRANDEIAIELHLSLATVKTYVGRLLAKLHARDRAQLVIIAYENGLVRANP
ncbi:response regulator transcription factor [Crossiella cryophila]|uniref:DNA-binding NarL/FixJ family response regulator n=1 Tax=Crossiella cryophila TaxID=43355 RepID=A0A7W7C793_9PSEU|nr:response regulator transcription factor [Crossiella cryophila]MBB4675791.1 DNA-binding NarL/FixJ family response regulator [Crossiella cryophila]